MRKLLLTLIVTMLAFVGTWAQETTVIDGGDSGTSDANSFFLAANSSVADQMTSGDKLKVYYRSINQWNSSAGFYAQYSWDCFMNLSHSYKESWGTGEWATQEITLTDNLISSIKDYGIHSSITNMLLQKMTLVSTKATSFDFEEGEVTLSKNYTMPVGITFSPTTATNITATTNVEGVTVQFSPEQQKLFVTVSSEVEATSVDITLSAPNVEPKTKTFNITDDAPEGAFSISPLSTTIVKGVDNFSFTVTGTVDNWSTSDAQIATVNAGAVTAVGRGVATITASNADNTISQKAIVTVKEQLNGTINFKDGKTSIKYGETAPEVSFQASNGATSADYSISYTSTNPDAFTVNSTTGEITIVGLGSGQIKAVLTATEAGQSNLFVDGEVYSQTFTINKSQYALTLAVEKTVFDGATEEQVTISPIVTLNGSPVTSGYYSIAYSSSDEINFAVDPTTGVVTVAANSSSVSGTITATLTVDSDKASLYEATNNTASQTLVINSNYTASGAIVTRESDGTIVIEIPDGVECSDVQIDYSLGWANPIKNELIFDNNASIADPLNAIKSATSIKIKGSVSNEDMQAFTYAVGGPDKPLKTLDMSGATLIEAITTGNNGNADISWITPTNANNNSNMLAGLTTLYLPKPAPKADGQSDEDYVASGKPVIPASFEKLIGNNASTLKNLVIPEGWVEIGKDAFYGIGIEKLRMPESLVYIRENAFLGQQIKKIFFPKNVDVIEANAFACDPSKVEDVFFTGKTAPSIVDPLAFSSATQRANNSMNDAVIGEHAITDGCATRMNYMTTGSTNFTCMMHYPSDLTPEQYATYVDVSRVFDASPRKVVAEDGTVTYINEKAGAKVKPWEGLTLSDEFKALLVESYEIDAAYFDPIFGSSLTWPSQQQMNVGWIIANKGYMWNGTKMTDEEKARQGVYQFQLARGDAPESQDEYIFEQKYTSGQWWTICVTFDMTVDEVKKVFGENTKVCKFTKVTRRPEAEGTEGDPDYKPILIRMDFTNDVMKNADPSDIAIEAHKAYMIKPIGETGDPAVYQTTTGKRRFPADMLEKSVTGAITPTIIKFNEGATESNAPYDGYEKVMGAPYCYHFTGNHSKLNNNGTPVLMPQYCYFLGWNSSKGKEQFYMQVGTTGKFTAHSAVVIEDTPLNDYETFFKAAATQSSAPFCSHVFADEDEATGIEQVQITCGDDVTSEFAFGKIFNLNGQYVGEKSDNLKPGFYIVNGKKFIKK